MVSTFLCSSLNILSTGIWTGHAEKPLRRQRWVGIDKCSSITAHLGLWSHDFWLLDSACSPIPMAGVSHSLVSLTAWSKPGCFPLSFHWLKTLSLCHFMQPAHWSAFLPPADVGLPVSWDWLMVSILTSPSASLCLITLNPTVDSCRVAKRFFFFFFSRSVSNEWE